MSTFVQMKTNFGRLEAEILQSLCQLQTNILPLIIIVPIVL